MCLTISPACMSVHRTCAVSAEAKRGRQISWEWRDAVVITGITSGRTQGLCYSPLTHPSI